MRLRVGVILLTIFVLSLIPEAAYSQDEEWSIFSSRFCTVFYEKEVDLDRLNRRINLRFSDFYNPRGYTKKVDFSTEDLLSGKLDAIFSRVEDILDMYPSRAHVTVNVYKNRKGLDTAYEGIFHEPNTAKSFYIYKTNTIYTTERVISEAILAHEMAHCIIDHYFVILPPRKIQEMLAVYADVHLKD